VSAERIGEVLDAEGGLARPAQPVTVFPAPGAVELDDVSFSYPGANAPVLQGISFHAERGETVAIVGSTGSGKSTLVSLIPRLFDVTGGAVRVAGVDVREADLDLLWKGIGLVPQRPFLFSGTVASNLRFGREEASDDELWEALEIAQARDFVSEMSGCLEATIAQGGTNVSGGQRQRLAIARALLRDPAVLILDEATSQIDAESEAQIAAAIEDFRVGRTTIAIAHRLSTVRTADRIVVMEQGAVADIGTHAQLLERCELYRRLVQTQLVA
jgi:ATP-binding cassette subfamily B protein